jgi:hypothetical protein
MAGEETTGLINGVVINARGNFVAGAWVMVSCGDGPLGGRIPGTFTDDRGHFAVGSLKLAQCSVTACKKQDDVPCPLFTIVTHPLQVKLTAKIPFVTVKVQLGERGTVITGTVRDAITGEALAAIFVLRPLKFPDRAMLMPSHASFRIFIAPSTDYNLEVSVPGYKDWFYADHHNRPGPLRLTPHAHLNLDVKLKPLN